MKRFLKRLWNGTKVVLGVMFEFIGNIISEMDFDN